MGAPAEAFFCKRGHRFDDLPGEATPEESEEVLLKGCLCGEKEVRRIYHYGGILDCLDLSRNIGHPIPGLIGTEPFRVKFLGRLFDASGEVIEAYHDLEVEVWDVSYFFAVPPEPESASPPR